MVGGVGARDAELEEAVQQALRSYFESEGFSEPTPARTGGLIFRLGDVMVRFLRLDRPPRHPFDVQVSVGLRRTDDIVDWVRISRLSTEGSIAHGCWTWELTDLPTLTAALERLREDVLIPHVAAFWRDPTLLDPVFEAQDREHERRFRAGVEQQNLHAARESFQHGHFREAEERFERMDRLSETDQRRRDIAHDAVQRESGQQESGQPGSGQPGSGQPESDPDPGE